MSRTGQTFLTNIRIKAKDPNLDFTTVSNYINSATQEVKADYRSSSFIRRETIKIFESVNEYPLPIPSGATETDFESIADLTEWFEGAESASRFNRTTPSKFARKYTRGYQDNYITPYIRNAQNMLLVDYKPSTISSVTVHSCDDLTTNGTWSASGDATNLTADDVTYVEGSGSLNFDLSVSSLEAILTNSTFSTVDLTDYENNAYFFAFVYLPSVTNLTDLRLRWGSSATAYWAKTVTTQHNGLAFQTGWNLISFEWNSATKTGSPTITAINYLRFSMTYTAAPSSLTDFRLDGIFSRQFLDMYFLYDSFMWFRNSSGVLLKTISDATDEFIGNEAEADLLQTKVLQNIFELEIVDDLKALKMEQKYVRMLRNLKSLNPEQTKLQSFVWSKQGLK